MSRFIILVGFIILVEGVGGYLGTRFAADEWYRELAKPFFNPPGFLFAIVWPALYLLIAIAGWRVFVSQGNTPGWGLWLLQMVLNWAWSPVFFGAHLIGTGIWIIGGVLLASLAFAVVTWEKDRVSSLCFFPYIAWLGFALLLNTSIWYLNVG